MEVFEYLHHDNKNDTIYTAYRYVPVDFLGDEGVKMQNAYQKPAQAAQHIYKSYEGEERVHFPHTPPPCSTSTQREPQNTTYLSQQNKAKKDEIQRKNR